jgi:hypothetical protein
MGTGELVLALAVGAALLALWTIARFPDAGPQTFRTAGLNVVVAFGLGWAIAPLVSASSTRGLAGVYFAVFAIILPSLAYIFWACGSLMRVLAHAMGGGGGVRG